MQLQILGWVVEDHLHAVLVSKGPFLPSSTVAVRFAASVHLQIVHGNGTGMQAEAEQKQ